MKSKNPGRLFFVTYFVLNMMTIQQHLQILSDFTKGPKISNIFPQSQHTVQYSKIDKLPSIHAETIECNLMTTLSLPPLAILIIYEQFLLYISLIYHQNEDSYISDNWIGEKYKNSFEHFLEFWYFLGGCLLRWMFS